VLNVLSMDETFHGLAPRWAYCVDLALDQSGFAPAILLCQVMLDWKPITTAPANIELELSIYDKGEYHTLVFPCRRDGLGWRDARANRHLVFEPTHWRPWKKNSE